MSPLVSINLCCYNGEKYLEETLQSIFSQTYKRWELVVINDGSTDSTQEIVNRHVHEGWPIVYHYQQNAGLGAARNKAIEMSSGSFIAFIDQDDLWLPKKLEKQIPLFDDPEVGLVFCDVLYFNDKGQTKRLYKRKPYWTGRCFPFLLSRYFLSLPTVVIRRSVLNELGEWFDRRFNMIEEADLFARIGYSWKLAMVEEPLAKWRVHASSFTYTKGNPLGKEMSLLLRKFHGLFPDFGQRFAQEIAVLQCQVNVDTALHHLRAGDKNRARDCLSKYKFSNLKTFILFFLTLLPMDFISFLYRLKSRLVLSSPTANN